MAFCRKCQGRDFEYMEDGRYYQGIHPFRNADYVFWDSQFIFLVMQRLTSLIILMTSGK